MIPLVLPLLVLAACAPKINSVRGAEDVVVASLNRPLDSHVYQLVSPMVGVIDSARAVRGTVEFELPVSLTNPPTDPQLYIRRREDNLVLSGRRAGDRPYVFENPYWMDWSACRAAVSGAAQSGDAEAVQSACRDVRGGDALTAAGVAAARAVNMQWQLENTAAWAERAQQQCLTQLVAAQKAINTSAEHLRSSSAWTGQQCVTPPMGSLPARPLKACDPGSSKEFAVGACSLAYLAANGVPFTEFDGCSSLGTVVKRYGNESAGSYLEVLGGPACGAGINYALGRDKTGADVLLDLGIGVIEGGVEEWADDLLESDSLVGFIGGAIIKIGLAGKQIYDFDECLGEVQQICTESYRGWRAEMNDALARPDEVRQLCERALTQIPELRAQEAELRSELQSLKSQVVSAKNAADGAAEDVAHAASLATKAVDQATPSRPVRLARARTPARVEGTSLSSYRTDSVFGTRHARDAWNGVMAGAGGAAAGFAPGFGQGLGAEVGPGVGLYASGTMTLLPARFEMKLSRVAAQTDRGWDWTTLSEEGTDTPDSLRLSADAATFRGEILLLGTRTPRFSAGVGGGLTRYRVTTKAEIDGEELTYSAKANGVALHLSVTLTPLSSRVAVRTVGEQAWVAAYGFERSIEVGVQVSPEKFGGRR